MCAMAYAEFQQELKKAQLTAREFARLIKMNESSITNYSSRARSRLTSRSSRN